MDAVFLHWRIPEAVSASFMPPGVAPDVFDGSAWVGLIGFRMQGAGLGRGLGVPYFGSFNEINVRLYSREPDGTRGVVFRSLDASRLAVVLAARAAGIPYVWSRASFLGADSLDSSGRTAGASSAGVDGAGSGRMGPRRCGPMGPGGLLGPQESVPAGPLEPQGPAEPLGIPYAVSVAAPGATSRSSRNSTPQPWIPCRSTSRPGSVCIPGSGAGPFTSLTRTVHGRCTGCT